MRVLIGRVIIDCRSLVSLVRLWLGDRGRYFRPGRMFIIEVVHIQCAKLFKTLEYAVLFIIYGRLLCAKRRAHS